jgi:hypothetical protein
MLFYKILPRLIQHESLYQLSRHLLGLSAALSFSNRQLEFALSLARAAKQRFKMLQQQAESLKPITTTVPQGSMSANKLPLPQPWELQYICRLLKPIHSPAQQLPG